MLMKKIKLFFTAIMVLVTAALASAQSLTVTGTVFDADSGEPIPFASIRVNGTMTGAAAGADGAYSNVACINPHAAQKWYELMKTDMEAALELESRIQAFMKECIDPFIVVHGYPNHACDRFMALVGGWADVGAKLRWPYSSIPADYVDQVRKRAHDIIPEFV